MKRSASVFLESLAFFAVTALAPVLITWHTSASYLHNHPGEGIGEGIIVLVTFPLVLIAAITTGFIVLKRYLGHIKHRTLIFVITLVTVYASYFLAGRYTRLLDTVPDMALWFTSTTLFPAIIITIAILVQQRILQLGIVLLGCTLQIAALIVGTSAFTLDRTERAFVKNGDTLGYTLYLPPSGSQWPRASTVYNGDMSKTRTVISMNDSELDLENVPGVMNIYELPRPASLPTTTCGPDYPAQHLAGDNSNYSCQLLVNTEAGDVYVMSYDYNNGQIPGVKEYFILKPDTVIFATYATISNDKPRVYDQAKSVDLLTRMAPVSGQQLLDRLGH